MSKSRRCIRITGTRTGKLRAKVETTIEDAFKVVWTEGKGTREAPYTNYFEVTIGGEKWKRLDKDLQRTICERAQKYIDNVQNQLYGAAAAINPIPFG